MELIKEKNIDEASFGNVIQSLGEMKEFFQSDINFKRRQPKMSDSTWSKNLERLVIFLAYCVNRLKLDPCLQLVENMNVVDSFIKYIKQARRVKNNTAALYVNALIVASKFLHAIMNVEKITTTLRAYLIFGRLQPSSTKSMLSW